MKSPSAVIKYILFGLTGDNRVHFYITSVSWNWPFRGHSDFTLQLQGISSLTSLLLAFLLRDFIMLVMRTFTVFLLKFVWNLLDFGKCWFTKIKNCLALFVEIFLLKGGMNQMVLRERFRFCFMSSSSV